MVYASWGQGVESEVAPNRAALHQRRPGAAGAEEPAVRSRHQAQRPTRWTGALAAFDIQRPAGATSAAATSTTAAPARPTARRATAAWKPKPTGAAAPGACAAARWLLKARREGSAGPGAQRPAARPTCRPQPEAAGGATTSPPCPAWPCWAIVTHEGERMVLPDNSVAHARLDPRWTWPLRYERKCGAATADLARRRRQPARPARLAGVALPVRPCLPVPAGAAHAARFGAAPRSDERSPTKPAIIRGCSSIAQLVERRTVNP